MYEYSLQIFISHNITKLNDFNLREFQLQQISDTYILTTKFHKPDSKQQL